MLMFPMQYSASALDVCLFHAILLISNPGLVLIVQIYFIFGSNLAVFSRISTWWLYCLCQGNLHDIIIGKTLCEGSYDLYTHQYGLSGINCPVILTQNWHGKRIIMPGHKCVFEASLDTFDTLAFGMQPRFTVFTLHGPIYMLNSSFATPTWTVFRYICLIASIKCLICIIVFISFIGF